MALERNWKMPSQSEPTNAIEEKVAAAASEKIIPEEVSAWLGRLVLLYGVPFNYLIPDEQMLPKESIRFFYLDPIWIQCLVQGACSVGSNGYGDTIIDKVMNQWVQPNTPEGKTQGTLASKKAASVRDRLRNQYEGVDLPKEGEDLDWPLTGFVLRSTVVEGWRGLEIMAYQNLTEEQKKQWTEKRLTEEQMDKLNKDGVAPVKPLRIEQLSKDVMLGIFNGRIGQLVIRQPQEGLHFGLTLENRTFKKTLRQLGYRDLQNAGEILDVTIDLSQNHLMRDQAKRVIDIKALAGQMKTQLSALEELKDNTFTSAEFAVEMIEAAGEFTFNVERSGQS
jgi:hypothetical protein